MLVCAAVLRDILLLDEEGSIYRSGQVDADRDSEKDWYRDPQGLTAVDTGRLLCFA